MTYFDTFNQFLKLAFQKELYSLIDLPAQQSYTSNILEQTSDSSSKWWNRE
jgi:hypothetical protein